MACGGSWIMDASLAARQKGNFMEPDSVECWAGCEEFYDELPILKYHTLQQTLATTKTSSFKLLISANCFGILIKICIFCSEGEQIVYQFYETSSNSG